MKFKHYQMYLHRNLNYVVGNIKKLCKPYTVMFSEPCQTSKMERFMFYATVMNESTCPKNPLKPNGPGPKFASNITGIYAN